MILTQEERDKFIIWLKKHVDSNKGLITEMRKLGTGMEPIINQYELRIAAYGLVAADLEKTESVTMGDKK